MKSIRELADEIGVSKQTIRKKIANLGLQTGLRKNGNQFAIDKQQESLIKSSFLETNRKPVTDNQSVTNANRFAFYELEIERLHNQLNAKDEQLKEKDQQISEKDTQLAELTKLLDQQQQLHLRQQLMLEEKKWWKRLPWNRKKQGDFSGV